MEAADSSEMLAPFYKTTRHHIADDSNIHNTINRKELEITKPRVLKLRLAVMQGVATYTPKCPPVPMFPANRTPQNKKREIQKENMFLILRQSMSSQLLSLLEMLRDRDDNENITFTYFIH
jgi:hypothetical protein